MNNIFKENTFNAIAFKLEVLLLRMDGSKKSEVAITHLAIGIDSQINPHVVAIEKVAEQHMLNIL